MDSLQKSAMIDFIRELLTEKNQQMEVVTWSLSEIKAQLSESLKENRSMHATIVELHKSITLLEKKNSELQERLNLAQKRLSGSSKRQNGKN